MGESWTAGFTGKWRVLTGGIILCGCYLAGTSLKSALGLIIPAGILGLFLLLALLGVRIIRLAWVEDAAAIALWLLPLWLLPAFVSVAEDKTFWRRDGLLFLGTVVLGLVVLWAFVGHVAQWLFATFPGDASDPGPLTDAEQRRAATDVADEEAAS